VRRWLFIAAITTALTFAFVVRARGEWIWDDVPLIQQNPELVEPGGLRSILTHDLFGGATGEPQPIYRPIPMLLAWLEAHLFGVALAPMRLVNVLLHALNGSLLFVYLRRRGFSEVATQAATAVFLLHPSVTEPVMWLSGSHDLLGVAFTLAALLAMPRWGLAAVFCALAFLSKELYAIAPLLLFLERRSPLPFAGTAAVFVLRWALRIGTTGDAVFGSIADHVRCLGTLLAHYGVQLATFSNGLTAATYLPISLGLAVVVVVGFLAAVLALFRRRHPAGLPLAWFVLSLAPLVIAVEVNRLLGNRYAYMPLVALALLVANGVAWLEPKLSPALVPIVAGVALLIGPVLALPTAGEASQWATALSLFGSDVERAPNDPEALFHYGNAVSRRQGCGEALPLYERAVTADPKSQRAWHNVAGCLINEHRYDEAVTAAERALALAPDDSRAEYNLGIALGQTDRKAESRAHLERAEALRAATQVRKRAHP
jgi:tetratricopeptide (TPR) repeat protein